MNDITTLHYLIVAATLFALGVTGVLTRRDVIVRLMSLELILTAVSLNLVAFSHMWGNLYGQVFAIFVIIIAAAQAVVGLAIAVASRRYGEIDIPAAKASR
jgi:NADH-quinone oxidoreductase subunit K